MRVLVLTSDLNQKATGICAYIVCKELSNRGHDVHVLNLGKKKDLITDGTLIIHNQNEDMMRRSISYLNETSHRISSRILSALHGSLIQLKALFTLVPPFSRHQIYVNYGAKLLSSESFDLIISVINPMETIIAAKILSNGFKVPYCAYCLDSIYGNNGVRLLSNAAYKNRALSYEEKYLSDAKTIIMMRECVSMYDNLHSPPSFLEQIKYVGLPLLTPKQNSSKTNTNYWSVDDFVILYVGTMPKRIRDPKYIISLLNRIVKGNAHLFIAGSSDYDSEISEVIQGNRNIHRIGFLAHDEVEHLIMNADILLNIGNSITTMLPSKIFEYMSYNKPILSTIKSLDDRSISYLKNYPQSIIVNENEDVETNEIKIRSFIEEVKLSIVQKKDDFIEQRSKGGFLYENTPQCVCELFENIIK